MDEYVKLLILAYFKEFNGRYNLVKLKEKIGISFNMLDNFIGELVENSELSYKNNMLSITQKGRLKLINSEMEDYSYSINLENEYSNSRWSIEKIYTVHEFSKKNGGVPKYNCCSQVHLLESERTVAFHSCKVS